jgi:hypothetical protein
MIVLLVLFLLVAPRPARRFVDGCSLSEGVIDGRHKRAPAELVSCC